MAQMERIYWIHGVLQDGAYLNWQEVADKFEVKRRMVFNDIQFLRDRLGAPVAFSRRYKGWQYTASNYQLPFLALSDKEADTLRRMLLAALASLPPQDALAVQHLAARLSPYVRRLPTHGGAMPASSEIFQSGHPTLAANLVVTDTLLAEIRGAMDERKRVRITYYSAHSGEVTERVVQPYFMLNWRGELYLIGYCELRKSLRDFSLHRIRARTVLGETRAFTIPDTFDPATYLESAFELRRGEPPVTVRLHFSKRQSVWVRERVVHPSQTLTEQNDGSVIMSLHVSGLDEVKKYILSHGGSVRVLEPESLRREIIAEAEKTFTNNS